MRFLSGSRGTGGTVKNAPEDFVVMEITGNGTVLGTDTEYSHEALGDSGSEEAKFTRFILQKRDWDTVGALTAIAKRLGRGRKSIGYSGTKDKMAVSVQLASIFGVSPEQLKGIRIKDISINGAWKGNEVELGSNIGNAFRIRVRNAEDAEAAGRTIEELNGVFPNYFDRQRFGYRLNNFRIGRLILEDKPAEAMMAFLADTSNEDNAGAHEARKRLADEQDFRSALQYFPRHLKYERIVIDYMSRYDNPANALRKLPRGILLLFIHAVESGVFNAVLERRLRSTDFDTGLYCRRNFYGFPDIDAITHEREGAYAVSPIIGYETKQEYIGEYEKAVMETMGISCDLFKIKSMPELSMKGTFRALLAPAKGMSCAREGGTLTLGFEIPSGSYATVLVNEITKTDDTDVQRMTGP